MNGWKQFWDIDKKQYYWSKQNEDGTIIDCSPHPPAIDVTSFNESLSKCERHIYRKIHPNLLPSHTRKIEEQKKRKLHEQKIQIMEQWRLQMENEYVIKLQSRYRMKKAEKLHARKQLQYKSATTIQL